MKLWRLTREPYLAFDGSGPMKFGGRYSSPGRPVVNFASEAGLAVLIALRYAQDDHELMAADHLLGWTEVDHVPERVPDTLAAGEKRPSWTGGWKNADQYWRPSAPLSCPRRTSYS
ncbi:RES family NAD+ phosphorylase [Tsuneonella flava]|uniref:RES family NAD+ phosphorylase n=1 Tax=Tsuneonella flava TaxID=2055955 RepID=A0ABX7K9V5_9SPHN|nr:RES family NAD+ phosphorylase [Tsuneonella flava]QSB44039.1 RES family NAD+ phosphorylase [Tsuneonella flava]